MFAYYVLVSIKTVNGYTCRPFVTMAESAPEAWESISDFVRRWNGVRGTKIILDSQEANGPFVSIANASDEGYRDIFARHFVV